MVINPDYRLWISVFKWIYWLSPLLKFWKEVTCPPSDFYGCVCFRTMCFAKGLHLPSMELAFCNHSTLPRENVSLLKDLSAQEVNYKDDIFSKHLYIILYKILAQFCFIFKLIKYSLGLCIDDQHSIYISPLISYLVVLVRKKLFLSKCF